MKIANPNMPQPFRPRNQVPRPKPGTTPGMPNPRIDLIRPRPADPRVPSPRPMPPRPGMSDPRVTPPRPPVTPGKPSPMGNIAAMVGKGLSQQSATQEGAMKAARAASLAAKKESGSMGGPFGSRNPNGPRKPMGSPSPMSGVAGSALSAMSKGLTGMKKGGMATKKKAGKISEYGGKEMYSSKKGMMKHEGMESMKMEKSEGMKMRGGGMAAKGKGLAMKKGGMAPKGRGMAIMIAIGKPKGRGKS